MSFNKAHRAYADAVMRKEAAALFRKRGPSTRSAANASYQASYRADQELRPGSSKGWYKATAKSVNKMIEREAKSAVKTAYRSLKRSGKIASAEEVTGMAVASMFGVASAQNQQSVEPMQMSRRALLLGGGTVAATAFLGTAGEAKADNNRYIGQVQRGVRVYTTNNAMGVVRKAYGAGSRANYEGLSPTGQSKLQVA